MQTQTNNLYNLLKKFDGKTFQSDDEEIEVTIKINQNISNIPLLPKIKGLKPVSLELLQEYYEGLSDSRISNINGQQFMDPEDSCYSCDYCKQLLENDNRYICNYCHTDMCRLCFEETTEEIAIKNGCKNYHLRKDKLNKCQNGHDLVEVKPNVDIFELTNFGNLVDWVPIYTLKKPTKSEVVQYCDDNNIKYKSDDLDENIETEYMFVHQNLNKDSDNFQKFGLSTIDDHGRFGIYSATHINSFNNLKQNIEKHYNTMLEHVPKGGWDSYYNNVIVLLMDEYGYMYHFG